MILTYEQMHRNASKRWQCHLICCGKDDGTEGFDTWEEADAFRRAYTSGPGVAKHGFSAPLSEGGHRRAVIIKDSAKPEEKRNG